MMRVGLAEDFKLMISHLILDNIHTIKKEFEI